LAVGSRDPIRPAPSRLPVGWWIAATVLLCAGGVAPATGAESAGERSPTPNVVLVLADDLGHMDPGVYNPNTVSPTPNIDRLAEQGIRFTDANTPASVCTPTRYAVLTGRYAWRTRLSHGVLAIFDEPLIEPGRVTLPEMMRRRGYRTAAIGKWHLGMNVPTVDGRGFARVVDRHTPTNVDFTAPVQGGPLDHGFDTYFGAQLPRVHAFVRDRHFVGIPRITLGDRPLEVEGWKEAKRGPRQLDAALEFIDRCRAEGRPFFLYFASQQPHPPFVPADTIAGVPVAGTTGGGARADCIKELDLTVGELVRKVDELGLARDTIVLVTSDNGPGRLRPEDARAADTGPLRGEKGGVFEAGHRVPLVVRWGDGTPSGSVIAPGRVSDEIVSVQDVMATVADVLGVSPGSDAAEDSESFLPLLRGEASARAVRDDLVIQGVNGQFAIREGRWKLVVPLDSVAVGADPRAPLPLTGELFDLASDPGERVDRAGDEPDRVRQLATRLNEIRRRGFSARRLPRTP